MSYDLNDFIYYEDTFFSLNKCYKTADRVYKGSVNAINMTTLCLCACVAESVDDNDGDVFRHCQCDPPRVNC